MKASTMVKRALKKLKRATPTILAVASGVGVVATAVLSAKATPKVMQISAEYDQSDGGEKNREK